MSRKISYTSLLMVFLLLLSPMAFAEQLQLTKVSDLQPGDTFLDENGNEVTVQTIDESNYNFITNLKDVLAGRNIVTGRVSAPITGNDIYDMSGRLLSGGTATSPSIGTGLTQDLSTKFVATPVTYNIPANNPVPIGTYEPLYADGSLPGTSLYPSTWANAGLEGNLATGSNALFGYGGADMLLTGLQWAGFAYLAGQFIGPLLGLNADQTDSLSTALAAGFGTYGVLASEGAVAAFGESSIGTIIGPGMGAGLVGLGVAVIVFVATYEKVKYEEVTFDCQPWQAPSGGNSCETCNEGDLPCSEYRCKSLGQSCEIVNEGTTDEACVYVNPNDVQAPVITPDETSLKENYGQTTSLQM